MAGESASASWETGVELDSTKTFTWTIKNINTIIDNSSLVSDQKIDVKVEATRAVPAMTLTISLSQAASYSDRFLQLNYVLQADDDRSNPTFEAKFCYINPANPGHFKTSTVRRNTPTGSWQLASQRNVDPWNMLIGLKDGAIHLEFIWKFYRSHSEGLRFPGGPSWNTVHAQSKKTELLQMLHSGRLSDVKVVSSDGHEFPAHKLILQAGSEVFEAMFRHQMAESTTGVITLDDLSATAVKFLLHFLYSSEILPISSDEDDQKGNDATFEEVFYLASKYGLKELATYLEEGIGNFCKEKNAVKLLKLCKFYSLEKGKQVIFDVARENQWNVLHDFLFSQL